MRHCFMNSGGVNPIDGFIFKNFFFHFIVLRVVSEWAIRYLYSLSWHLVFLWDMIALVS